VRAFSVEEKQLRAQVDHGATALPVILAVLDGYRVPVISATISRPSLDDVYLQYVGHSYDHSGTTVGGPR
jgi:ABC-2 type transport system ATP-binding protein